MTVFRELFALGEHNHPQVPRHCAHQCGMIPWWLHLLHAYCPVQLIPNTDLILRAESWGMYLAVTKCPSESACLLFRQGLYAILALQ